MDTELKRKYAAKLLDAAAQGRFDAMAAVLHLDHIGALEGLETPPPKPEKATRRTTPKVVKRTTSNEIELDL